MFTAPSNTPENAFIAGDVKQAYVCEGPTIDNQILRKLFASVIHASTLLGADIEFRDSLKSITKQLPPNQIASDGRLMEWIRKYKEIEPQHRHVSHLWGTLSVK